MAEDELLREHLDARIDEPRIHAAWRGVEARLGQRGTRWTAPVIAVAAIASIAVIVWPRTPSVLVLDDGSAPTTIESGAMHQMIALGDGSMIALDPGTTLVPTRNDGEHFELEMLTGGATFSVTPGGPRRWVIDAGEAEVTVVGTVFRIEHLPSGEVEVSVERGRVSVSNARGARELGAGERHRAARGEIAVAPRVEADVRSPTPVVALVSEPVAPPLVMPAAPRPPRAPPTTDPPEAVLAALPDDAVPEAPSRWAALAAAGDHRAAYAALEADGMTRAMDGASPDVLLGMADVARLSGHPRDAVGPLELLLRDHAADGRAPLAAIMLGRIHQDALHDAAAAVTALDRALALGPPAALRLDVESRLALALLEAGDERGPDAARRFLSMHPSGPRAHAIFALLRETASEPSSER